MIRRPPRSTPLYSSAASDVYKRQPNVVVYSAHQPNRPYHRVRGYGTALRHLLQPPRLSNQQMLVGQPSICSPQPICTYCLMLPTARSVTDLSVSARMDT